MVESDSQIINRLAEEFVARLRSGECPTIGQYTERYPELADEIRETIETLAVVEQLAPAGDASMVGDGASDNHADPTMTIDRLGDFRLVREIGRGGMGIVFEAEQVSLGRHVALKLLPQQFTSSGKYLHRFQREARSAARLHHTNIVPVFGVGESNGLHYYVMQIIQGQALDDVLLELRKIRDPDQRSDSKSEPRDLDRSASAFDLAQSLATGDFLHSNPPVDPNSSAGESAPTEEHDGNPSSPDHRATASPAPSLDGRSAGAVASSSSLVTGDASGLDQPSDYWHRVARIGCQVASALDYAHTQGVLHRDVKPGNILLDLTGTAWITDFGLAKDEDQRALTCEGDILGTLRYLAPEALHGNNDARSDVYSLGVTLYEMLSLKPAYESRDRNQLIQKVASEPPPRLNRIAPAIPRDLVTIIHKAIETDPAHRYRTAHDLEEDLQRFLDDRPIKARRVSLPERFYRWSRRNVALAAALTSVAALLVTLGLGAIAYAFEAGNQKIEADELRDEADHLKMKAEERAETAERRRIEAEEAKNELARVNYAKSMRVVGDLLAKIGGVFTALPLLHEYRPKRPGGTETDPRGWEWYFALAESLRDQIVVSDRPALSIDWHPTEELLVVGELDGTVLVWCGSTNRVVDRLSRHIAPVVQVAWSPTGHYLSSFCSRGQLVVWDTRTWQPHFEASLSRPIRMAWSPDGQNLAVAGAERWIEIMDVSEKKSAARLDADASSLCWGPDNERLAYSDERLAYSDSDSGNVVVWNVCDNREERRIPQRGGVLWQPHGDALVVSSPTDSVIFNALTGKRVANLPVPANHGYTTSCWSQDGKTLAISFAIHGRSQVWVFDASDWSRIASFDAHRSSVEGLSWIDSKILVSTSRDRTVRFWDVAGGRELRNYQLSGCTHVGKASPDGLVANVTNNVQVFRKSSGPMRSANTTARSCSLFSDGRRIAVLRENEIHILDIEDLTQALRIIKTDQRILRVAVSPDEEWIAASLSDGKTIRVWNVKTAAGPRDFTGGWDPFTGFYQTEIWVAWSPDSRRLMAAGAGDRGVIVWDLESKKIECEIPHEASQEGSELDPRVYLGCGPQGTVFTLDGNYFGFLYDGKSGQRKGRIRGHASWELDHSWLMSADWNPIQENQLVTTSLMGSLCVWDTQTQTQMRTLTGHVAAVMTVAWSPRGDRIASGDDSGEIKIWDPVSGRELFSLTVSGPVRDLHWTSDQLRLIACVEGTSNQVQVFDATLGYLHEQELALPSHPLIAAEGRLRDGDYRGVLEAVEWARSKRDQMSEPQWERLECFESLALMTLEPNTTVDQDARPSRQFTGPSPWNVEIEGWRQSSLLAHAVATSCLDRDMAAEIPTDLIGMLKGSAQYHATAGRYWFCCGDYRRALVDFRSALRLWPNRLKGRRREDLEMKLCRSIGFALNSQALAAQSYDEHVSAFLPQPNTSLDRSAFDPVEMAAAARYLHCHRGRVVERLHFYIAMCQDHLGKNKAAKETYQHAVELLSVRPPIDDGTLTVWREAGRQLLGHTR